MDYLSDIGFVAAACASAFVIGMSRGGFAGGIAFAGVLLMAQIMPPLLAAGFVLPILCFVDPLGNYVYRKHISWPNAKVLLPSGLVGIALGTALIYVVDENMVRIFIALLTIYMVADRVQGTMRGRTEPHTYSKPVGFFLGTVAGFSTFLIHAGHPPVSAYLLPQRLPRMVFLGTFALLFTTFNYIKLAPYAWLGLIDWSLLGVSVVFFPVALAGFYFGRFIALRISDRLFYQIMYVSVFVMGMRIGYLGLVGYLA